MLTVGINSYVTRADADAYFADRLYVTEWTDAEPDDQDRALLMARRVQDQQAWLSPGRSAVRTKTWPSLSPASR